MIKSKSFIESEIVVPQVSHTFIELLRQVGLCLRIGFEIINRRPTLAVKKQGLYTCSRFKGQGRKNGNLRVNISKDIVSFSIIRIDICGSHLVGNVAIPKWIAGYFRIASISSKDWLNGICSHRAADVIRA